MSSEKKTLRRSSKAPGNCCCNLALITAISGQVTNFSFPIVRSLTAALQRTQCAEEFQQPNSHAALKQTESKLAQE